ncbi:MAG: sugar transferase [Hyphomicrobiales bacterium]|nr:sugar transferase [Hyphomicrobiales bacterium]
MTRLPSSLVRLSHRFRLSDLLAGTLAPLLAILFREFNYFSHHNLHGIVIYSLVACGATAFGLAYFRVSQILSRFLSTSDLFRILKAAAAATLITAVIAFSFMRLDAIPRSMPALHFMLLAGMLAGTRLLRSEHYRRRDAGPRATEQSGENVILVGATRMAWFYMRMLGCMPEPRQRIIALVDDDIRLHGRSVSGHLVAGPVNRLEALVTEYATHGIPIHRLVVTDADFENRPAPRQDLENFCAKTGIALEYMTELFHAGTSAREAPLISAAPTPAPAARLYWRLRRAVDIFVATTILILLSPAFVIVALLVVFDIGTPTVFWQERVGRFGRRIAVHKYRTFKAPVDRHGREIADVNRLSRIGRFLRASRLDELPQAYDILCGEMSLIGPRPLLPIDQPKDAAIRLQARPGLTGWAQVHGGKLVTAEEKNALDEWYIAHVSLRVDLRIIRLTLLAPFRGDRRKERVVLQALQFQAERLAQEPQTDPENDLRAPCGPAHRPVSAAPPRAAADAPARAADDGTAVSCL